MTFFVQALLYALQVQSCRMVNSVKAGSCPATVNVHDEHESEPITLNITLILCVMTQRSINANYIYVR